MGNKFDRKRVVSYQIGVGHFVHYMKTVKNTQIRAAVYREQNQRLAIDQCLPQRHAIEEGKIGFHALSHGHYPGTRISPQILQGVPSMGFLDVIGVQNWGIPPHRNEGVEICYQETGKSVLTVDGEAFQSCTNTLSITRPWQLHSLGAPYLKPGRFHWLIIDVGVRRPNQSWTLPDWCVLTPADQEELITKLRGNETPVWTASAEIGRVFTKLSKLVSDDQPVQNISRIRINLNQLLTAMLDLMRVQHVIPDEALTSRRRVVALFLKELQQQPDILAFPWTLDRMAEHCGMGRTTFSGYCRDLINTTPMEILNLWRLEHAAVRLTREPDKSIITIALDSGFSSSQYFARKFLQRYELSPRQWRKKTAI
jgi:AraC-like DNA-binding protein